MRGIPLSTIESWPKPNYVNPQTHGPILYIIYAIFFAVATVAVAIRLYTRIAIRRWLGLDDAFAILAYALNVCIVATVCFHLVRYDLDRHVWDLHLAAVTPATKATFMIKVLWSCASASIRLSLLCFFYRLLTHVDLCSYRWVLHCNVAFVIAIWICFMFTTVFTCMPVRSYWTLPGILPGECINERYPFTILSAFNTLSELLIALMPIPIIRKLTMPQLQKWTVMGLLGLGVLVTIVGTLRTYYAWVLLSVDDGTWWTVPYAICSEVEIDTALACACAPAMLPFFSRLASRGAKRIETTLETLRTGESTLLTSSPTSRQGTERQEPLNLESKTSPWGSSTREYDLEGIHTEGFGYKVSITADPSLRSPSRLLKRKTAAVTVHSRGRARRIDGGDGALHGRRRSLVLRDRLASWCNTTRQEEQHGAFTLRVHTQQEVEVRESFHEEQHLPFVGFDYRNAVVSALDSEGPQHPTPVLARPDGLPVEDADPISPEEYGPDTMSAPFSSAQNAVNGSRAFLRAHLPLANRPESLQKPSDCARNLIATAPMNSSNSGALQQSPSTLRAQSRLG